MKNHPPRLAQRFFSWYCNNQLRDSILGDLDEQFYLHQNELGTLRAQLLYWLNVFRFINRFTLKRSRFDTSYNYYSTSMIKNNLISSFRFFSRKKGFAFINVFGLTLGFSSFLLILLFVNHELSFDKFHDNKAQVFRINFSYQDNAGNVTKLVNSPPALAPGVAGQFPELNKISRMRYTGNCLFSFGERGFYESYGYYADSLFLEILQFGLLDGNPKTALDQPNSIVITEEMAVKYFKGSDPLGATLMMNNSIPLKVTGVLSSIPSNSHLNFDYLISFPTYIIPEGYASDLTSWSWLGFLTYVELNPNADPNDLEQKLVQHFRDLNHDNPNPMLPKLQNLSDIYLGSVGFTDDVSSNIRSGNSLSVKALAIVAILILLVAGFNYSNLTNALSINRSKATGIRKVLGASKNGIIGQLLTESLILALLCLMLSFCITFLIFPVIAHFMGWEFNPGFQEVLNVFPIMLMASIFIGLASGLYPALTLAGFDINKSLKGSLKIGTRNPFQLKKILVMLQFIISIGLISATIIVSQQIHFLLNKDTGYNAENVVLVKMLPEDMSRYFEVYKERLVQNASVLGVSQSDRVVGEPWPWSIIQRTDQGPEMSQRTFFNLTDYDFYETMGIRLSEGRSFSKEYANEATGSIVINQRAAESLGLDDPVGQSVHFFGHERTIIGVTEDFNYTSLHEEIGPVVTILPFIDLEYMYVRFAPAKLQNQIEILEGNWLEVSDGTPFEWRFLDDNLAQLYQTEQRLSGMIQIFSMLTILLACLGLFGIVKFMINNRIKEVGVRKVLGASISGLYTMLVSRYLYQTILAMFFISPVMHYFLVDWLEGFAYHIQINWLVYPIATILLITMILMTISFEVIKAARLNPTLLLRNE